MSSTKTTLILAAVILAAAFAGILVSEDSDATEETTFSVSYVVGEGENARTYMFQADESNKITLKTLEDLGATAPDGKAFAGWSDGSTTYTAGSVLTLDKDTTLTAQFTAIKFTITYVVDGQTVDTETGEFGAALTGPEKVPVKDGYIFKGWDAGDGKVVTELPKISGDVTYTAVFAEDFEVTFVVDGTTITTTNISDLQVPSDPSKDGSEFKGWALVDGTVVDPETYEFTADTTLTAAWRADTLTVTFVMGEEKVGEVLVEYGTVIPTNTVPALAEGYSGWDKDLTVPVTGDMTVTAVLEELTVTFVIGEETKEITVEYGSVIAAEDIPVLDEDVYSGWSSDLTKPVTRDITVTAQEIVVPEEQDWFDDTGNQMILLIVGVLVAAVLLYCAWMIHEGTFPFKVTRKGKE